MKLGKLNCKAHFYIQNRNIQTGDKDLPGERLFLCIRSVFSFTNTPFISQI